MPTIIPPPTTYHTHPQPDYIRQIDRLCTRMVTVKRRQNAAAKSYWGFWPCDARPMNAKAILRSDPESGSVYAALNRSDHFVDLLCIETAHKNPVYSNIIICKRDF